MLLNLILLNVEGPNCERKTRQIFALGEKGLNLAVTSVMKWVIMADTSFRRSFSRVENG